MKCVKSCLVILFLCCFSFWAKAQKFTVLTSAEDVVANQAFDIEFVIENGRGAEFSPPNFSPAKIVSGPFTRQESRSINGVSSYKKIYTYQIAYPKPGKYTIPKAKIKYGTYTKSSKPLTINVLKASSASTNEELYLTVEMSDTSIFVGEQFLVDHHVIFSNINLRGVSLSNDFNPDQFITYDISDNKQYKTVQKKIDGKLRNISWINRMAFMPLRSGELEIPPMLFNADIRKNNARRSFFGSSNVRRVLKAEAINLRIKPLPEGAPTSFTGAVGRLSATSSVTDGEKEVGKEILVQLELSGNGIKDQVNAPEWKQEGFEIFDPKLLGEDHRQQNGEIFFVKTYEYIVIPQTGGNQRLEIPYAYFDTDKEEYIEKVSRSTQLKIKGDASNLKDATAKNIKAVENNMNSKWYNQFWFWGLLVAIAGFLVYYFTSRKPKEIEEAPISEEEAALIKAKRQLAGAKSILDSGNTSKYWETLENSLRIYLEEKIGIGTTAYSMDRVEQFWKEKELTPELLGNYKQMVTKINLARYAGQSISDMQNLYKEAESWIVETEKISVN